MVCGRGVFWLKGFIDGAAFPVSAARGSGGVEFNAHFSRLFFSAARGALNDDRHIVSDPGQHAREAIHRVAAEVAAQQTRQVGLRDVHFFRRLLLRQFATADFPADGDEDVRFDLQSLGVAESEVGEHVAASRLDGDFFFRHVSVLSCRRTAPRAAVF